MLQIIVKLIAVLFALISITKSYLDYKKKLEPQVMMVFWSVIWIIAATVIIYPSLIDKVISYSKDRTVTLSSLTGLAFVFLLYIVYRIYTKASRIEYQQAELIRKLGLSQSSKEDGPDQ